RVTQLAHEFRIRQRIGRADVDDTADAVVVDQESYCTNKIIFVNPGDELPTAGGGSTDAKSDHSEKMRENSAPVRAHGHRRSHDHGARSWQWTGLSHRLLPRLGDVDAETPGFGSARFV